jgi:hypothetical protein
MACCQSRPVLGFRVDNFLPNGQRGLKRTAWRQIQGLGISLSSGTSFKRFFGLAIGTGLKLTLWYMDAGETQIKYQIAPIPRFFRYITRSDGRYIAPR